MAVCLEKGADLHTAQLMPLPLKVSSFSKIQIGFTFLVPAHPGSPGQRAVKRVCVICIYAESVRRRMLSVRQTLSEKRQHFAKVFSLPSNDDDDNCVFEVFTARHHAMLVHSMLSSCVCPSA